MANVCLVSLPNPILGSPRMQVPLGILYIASVLEKNGHSVFISDMRAEQSVNMALVPKGYDIYGVSATTGEYHYAKEFAEEMKKWSNSLLVIGGPHATHLPVETLKETFYDIAVYGEGELTMLDIVNEVDFCDIKGIAYRHRDSSIVINPKRALISDLDSLPFPARHLLPFDHVFTTTLYPGERYGHGEIGTTIMTERGCPYSCAYCANWDRGLRLRSIDNVIKEFKECIDNGCRNFKIIDDEFGVPKNRYLTLCSELAKLNIKFRAHTRADQVTRELMIAMKAAGCEELALGIETPDETILKAINKKQTYEQCVNAVKIAKAAGLRVKTYLMCCLPNETWSSVEKLKQFITESKPDKFTLSTCVPYPGSDMAKSPDKYNIKLLEPDYTKYWLYADDPLFSTDVATVEELKEHRLNLQEWLRQYDIKQYCESLKK